MFGFGKKADTLGQVNAPDMSGVKPGSPEERELYNTFKTGQAVVEAAQRASQETSLKVVGGEVGVVKPDDSLLIHSGEHPIVNIDAEQPPAELPPQ